MSMRRIYDNELLATKRLVGDPPADQFVRQVFSDSQKKLQLQQWMTAKSESGQLRLLQEIFPETPFINNAGVLPAWAEIKLMKAGAAFFARHSEIIMSLLGLLSLPYCYTAANGAMVLYQSELIRKQTTNS